MSEAARIELGGGGWLLHFPAWLDAAKADALFAELRERVPWRHEPVVIAGREILQPRLTAWYGDPGASYAYSGITMRPEPFLPSLLELRRRLAQLAGQDFNSALLNLYRDGNDSVGYHADAERELGENPLIASVSLGATRRFVMRPRKRRPAEASATIGAAEPGDPVELSLAHGSLLLVGGTTQHHWKHAVPKERRVREPRINLTFRRIVSPR